MTPIREAQETYLGNYRFKSWRSIRVVNYYITGPAPYGWMRVRNYDREQAEDHALDLINRDKATRMLDQQRLLPSP